MKIIVTENKKEKMSEYAEKMLKYGGKLMQCIEELGSDDMGQRWEEDDDIDERGGYGMRGGNYGNREGGYGNRYGNRWADDDDMGERRRRRSNGRYY